MGDYRGFFGSALNQARKLLVKLHEQNCFFRKS